MAEPCCDFCAALGYRSCDACGGPTWESAYGNSQNLWVDSFGRELCTYCK